MPPPSSPDALTPGDAASGDAPRPPSWRRVVRTGSAALVAVPVAYLGACTLLLVAYAVVFPPLTAVQAQRAVEAWLAGEDYARRYRPVPRERIADVLALAVVGAEDTRFYQHTGIDWAAVGEALEDNLARGRVVRGGSTISQQLVKNLFLTTRGGIARKAVEVPLTYAAEVVLSKERILTLYLNVIEWDDGVFGAEAAAQRYYGTSADGLTRYQAAALAAVIPNPRGRSPGVMGGYARTILRRMTILEREGLVPASAR